MKKSWLFHLAAVGLGLTAGCQQRYWYQEGKAFDECKADHADCRAELLKRTDLHHLSDYERRFMEDCMQQRGYRLLTEKQLPLDVKREEPNVASATPWSWSYGLAGSISEPPPSPEPVLTPVAHRGPTYSSQDQNR